MSTPESRQTIRQVGGLAAQRLVLVGSAVAFAALIPRTMGPEVYGQFSLIYTMTLWFALLNGLGAVSMMTRFVPEFVAREDWAGLHRLTGGMLALRFVNGLLSCLVYFAIASLWLTDLDRLAIALAAVSITLRTVANLPFTLLLGLNQAARWGAAETVRQGLYVPLAYAGFRAAGLRGACLSLPFVELVVLALGLWWARAHIPMSSLRIDREFLKPFLRSSAGFMASNILIVLFDRGGAPLLHLLSGEYAGAGYYTLATGAYLTATGSVWKLLTAFGPLFTSLRTRGETAELCSWVERLLKVLAAVAVLVLAFVDSCGPMLIRVIVGKSYEGVAPLFTLLGLAGIAFGPGAIARLLAVSFGEPRSSIVAAALQAAGFALVSLLLIPLMGVRGAVLGVVFAVSLFAAYGTWHMHGFLNYSLRRWAQVILAGAICSPAIWAWSVPGPWRFGIFCLLFLAVLLKSGLCTADELRSVWRRPKPAAAGL